MRYRLFAIMFLVFVVHAVSYAENGKYALIITSFQVELNKYQMNLNDFYHEVNGEHPDLVIFFFQNFSLIYCSNATFTACSTCFKS